MKEKPMKMGCELNVSYKVKNVMRLASIFQPKTLNVNRGNTFPTYEYKNSISEGKTRISKFCYERTLETCTIN